jgi:phage terminase small subunit
VASQNKKSKRELFVQEYLVDLNATQAAIRAGYSQKSAHSQGERLLRNVEVKKEIEKRKKSRAELTDVKAHEVIRELVAIAFSDVTKIYEPNGNGEGLSLKSLDEIPLDLRRCIKSIEQRPIVTKESGYIGNAITKVSFYDKTKAIDLLGRHLGLWDNAKEGGSLDHLQSLIDAIRG